MPAASAGLPNSTISTSMRFLSLSRVKPIEAIRS
ncbi:Uncharacterised protein [Vibrio cholerae]|nr:Uncharacterised protein [Vibrio cholerae]CSC70177.1 Uncharacterised protein [Vibrio cholerae]